MRQLTTDVLREFLDHQESPCISLYQPTHRTPPDKSQDVIRFKNLVREAERSLREKYRGREIRALLEPFQTLADDTDFWAHTFDGLAVLASEGRFDIFRLQRPVKELLVVADGFHLKPLWRIMQSADRYQALGLNQHEVRLFEGNRDAFDEIDVDDMPATITAALGDQLTDSQRRIVYSAQPAVAAGKAVFQGQGGRADEMEKDRERFFRVIDREVLTRFSRPSGLPLILVALPELQTEFRRLSQNPFLLAESVGKHFHALDTEQLRAEIWRALEPKYLARLAQLVENYQTAASRHLGTSDLSDAAQAVAAARIGTLLIEADREIPGRLDAVTGRIAQDRLADPEVDDMLDDLAEAVLRTGGEVVVVPAERMPTTSGLAATFRH